MSEPIFPERIQPDSYVPLRVQVYGALREAIVTGKLRPGERIIEDRLCGELGVSRSPLREALRRLEGEGLVTILPRRGAIVTDMTNRDGLDLFAVREVLEGLAARLAAQHITSGELAELEEICRAMEKCIDSRDTTAIVELNTQFHELVTRSSRNRWIREFVPRLRAQTRRFYRTTLEIVERPLESLAEHRQIVAALRARDVGEAETLARKHVMRARDAAATALAAGLGSFRG